MKKVFSLLLLSSLLLGIGHPSAQAQSIKTTLEASSLKKIQAELRNPKSNEVLVVAHRADWRNAPENSIQGIRRVIEIGVDIIEIDVQLTRDGHLVLMHDQTIDRTTSGKGKVADYTLEELRKLTLRTGSGTPTRQLIPTFEECMLEVKGKVLVNVDKGFEYFNQVYEILKKTGTVDHAILKSSLPGQDVNERYGKIIKEMVYMPMCAIENEASLTSTAAFIKSNNALMVEVNFKDSTILKQQLGQLKKLPVRIWINSLWGGIDDELAVDEGQPDAAWGWLIRQGARAIQTDRPAELLEYLRKNGFHR